jgi:hypothetical protein
LFACSYAFAGELFGTIEFGDKTVGEGVRLELLSANKEIFTCVTDKFGAYRLFVKENGKCTLTIYFKDQSPSVVLFSYDKSTRYDWVLEFKDGKYSVRRK